MVLTRKQLRRLVLQEIETLVRDSARHRGDEDEPRARAGHDPEEDLLLNDPISEDELLAVRQGDGYLERSVESVSKQLNEIQDRSNLLLGSLRTDKDADIIADNVRKAHTLLSDAHGVLEGSNE